MATINLGTITPPTVPDQAYNPLSTRAQSGVAVKNALSEISIYQEKTSVEADNIDVGIDRIYVRCHTTLNDKGAAHYQRVGTEPAHIGKIQSNDGAWWEVDEEIVTPQMFGIAPSSTVSIIEECASIVERYDYLKIPYQVTGISMEVSNVSGNFETIRLTGGKTIDFGGNTVYVNTAITPVWAMTGDGNRVIGEPHYVYKGGFTTGMASRGRAPFYEFMGITDENDKSFALTNNSLSAIGVVLGPAQNNRIGRSSFNTVSDTPSETMPRIYSLFGAISGNATGNYVGMIKCKHIHCPMVIAEQDGLFLEGVECTNRIDIVGEFPGHLVYITEGTGSEACKDIVIDRVFERSVLHDTAGETLTIKGVQKGVVNEIDTDYYNAYTTQSASHVRVKTLRQALDGALPASPAAHAQHGLDTTYCNIENYIFETTGEVSTSIFVETNNASNSTVNMTIKASPVHTRGGTDPMLSVIGANTLVDIDYTPSESVPRATSDNYKSLCNVQAGAVNSTVIARCHGEHANGAALRSVNAEPTAKVKLYTDVARKIPSQVIGGAGAVYINDALAVNSYVTSAPYEIAAAVPFDGLFYVSAQVSPQNVSTPSNRGAIMALCFMDTEADREAVISTLHTMFKGNVTAAVVTVDAATREVKATFTVGSALSGTLSMSVMPVGHVHQSNFAV